MMIFAFGIEHPLEMTVQRLHDPDPRYHRRTAVLRDEDQRFHRGLPFRRRVLGLRQRRDVAGGIPQSEELSAIWKRYWILKRGGPGHGKDFFEMGAGRAGGRAKAHPGLLMCGATSWGSQYVG